MITVTTDNKRAKSCGFTEDLLLGYRVYFKDVQLSVDLHCWRSAVLYNGIITENTSVLPCQHS
jgi:hypothetical protein